MWEKLRAKGFGYYFSVVFLLMMILLTSVDFIFDLYFSEESFDAEYVWWDIPINIILSSLCAVFTWYYKGKPLKLKSDVIEMNLSEHHDKKEKQVSERQAD